MANEFYALMGRMRYITRWGLMRNTFSENISEHSHMTAVLAHALALIRRDILNLPAPDPDRCAVAALYHDASEILTGDLPTPIKYYNPDIKTAYKEVERIAGNRLLDMLPPRAAFQLHPLCAGGRRGAGTLRQGRGQAVRPHQVSGGAEGRQHRIRLRGAADSGRAESHEQP